MSPFHFIKTKINHTTSILLCIGGGGIVIVNDLYFLNDHDGTIINILTPIGPCYFVAMEGSVLIHKLCMLIGRILCI